MIAHQDYVKIQEHVLMELIHSLVPVQSGILGLAANWVGIKKERNKNKI